MPTLQFPHGDPPSERRLAVRVTPDAERQIRGGHPWVFEQSITSVSHEGAPGDLAVVFDRRRQFVAIGLWDPSSPIRLRVLHQGRPTPIDESWWAGAIGRALAVRQSLARSQHTNAYRLIHGENDGLPGLIVDRYADTLVVKIYTPALFSHLPEILGVLVELCRPDRIVLRWARTVGPHAPGGLDEGATVYGPPISGPAEFCEHDLLFGADLVRGHKTGHFLDQRDNRQRVAAVAGGASVLDVFSCSGGFALHAAAAGAASIRLVDVNPHALEEARRNIERNRSRPTVDHCQVTTITGDGFAVLEDLSTRPDRFDIVVVDPPSFASRRRDVDRALEAYRRLAALAMVLVTPGGLLVQASCSSRVSGDQLHQSINRGAERAQRSLSDVVHHGHPVDHPIGFAHGAYLDAVFARVQ